MVDEYRLGRALQPGGSVCVTGGERLGAMADYLLLPPGAYTMHVSDDAGEGGTVLMEAYEVP